MMTLGWALSLKAAISVVFPRGDECFLALPLNDPKLLLLGIVMLILPCSIVLVISALLVSSDL